MPFCPTCEVDHETAALVRHERHGFVVVHCPDCKRFLGRYRDPVVH
ncbi:hypothetical protein [Halomarina rubra]|uniref:Small CPxCG-related zinc finger protein n=1 Tax=Halomarina rubra TaxID=2071873 RepID=A0ABD6B0U1_9EURY|nr:hypothetical protein [Halomarina rubra]